jgi:protein-tyrosine-phosphatase
VDLRDHRTTPLGDETIVSADVILAMELGHIVAIRRRCGRLRRKAFLVGCLSPAAPLEIADPIGKDDTAFDACFEHIVRALVPLVELLAAQEPAGAES